MNTKTSVCPIHIVKATVGQRFGAKNLNFWKSSQLSAIILLSTSSSVNFCSRYPHSCHERHHEETWSSDGGESNWQEFCSQRRVILITISIFGTSDWFLRSQDDQLLPSMTSHTVVNQLFLRWFMKPSAATLGSMQRRAVSVSSPLWLSLEHIQLGLDDYGKNHNHDYFDWYWNCDY